MARQLRVQYAGAIYHVMSRGDRRESIFEDDQDRIRFLETLAQVCQKTGWQVHAWCLMDNHFHLVVETPQPNLVAGMKWFLGTYTGRFNRRHKEFGHLFSGRYKALVVDGSGNGYLKTVCDYVHLNPARAKVLKPGQRLEQYRWSSFVEYLKAPSRRVSWLRVDRLLGEWRIPKDSPAGRKEFARVMEERRRRQDGQEFGALKRGWCLGDEAFRRELLEQVQVGPGPSHYGEVLREAVELKAQRLLQEGLRKLGWSEQDLAQKRKGDEGKVKLALELRNNTTMPLEWIAGRLQMGTRGYLTWPLQRQKTQRQGKHVNTIN